MSTDSSYPLESLERRWQLEKTPQVGLRLAEQYRRQGNLEASIDALTDGLEVYPNHTASRVALSRYLVDGSRFEEAVTHLEQIIGLDPAHLVANKLLVGAYAGVGRIDDARDKLAIYEMMGEGDADIERLQLLLNEAKPGGVDAHTEQSPTVLVNEPTVVPASDRSEADESQPAFEVSPASSPPRSRPVVETPDESAGREPAMEMPFGQPTDPPTPDGEADRSAAVEDDPFGLALEADESADYWQSVAAEGIFALDVLEPSGAEKPEKAATPEVSGGASDLSSEPRADAPIEPLTESPDPEETAAGGDPTVTLGKLYFEQGHEERAAEVFEQVLAREPDNEAARAASGLLQVESSSEETAEEALEEEPGKMAERKIQILNTYIGKIRQAVAAGV